MPHKFRLGQLVRLRSQAAARNASRIYEIVSLLPDDAEQPGYRIRSTEAGTCEAREPELVPASRTSNPAS